MLQTRRFVLLLAGGELFMQLEREGIFMEDTAWWVEHLKPATLTPCLQPVAKAEAQAEPNLETVTNLWPL